MVISSNESAGLRPLVVTGWEDLIQGLTRWDIFTRMGWLEVKRRYRRTIIGPFWSALSLGVFVLALGTVGGGLFSKSFSDFLPFLAAGMVTWVTISTMITESGSLFLASQNLFRQMQFNYSILAYALIWRNLITFLHNLAVYVLVSLLVAPHLLVSPTILLAPVGLVIVFVNGTWIALLLGMACLRFRDLQQLISTVVQIAMFVTPIFWEADSLSGLRHLVFVYGNPLSSLIEVVRAPLLGRVPTVQIYGMAMIYTVVGWSLTLCLFHHFRKRIAYWT